MRATIRGKHYSRRTEKTYVHWIKRFIYFTGKRHPAEMGAPEVTAFLNDLATERNVAAATQNQALSALLFLYQQVPGHKLPWLDDMVRAKRPVRLPVVLTEAESRVLLAQLDGVKWLMASLLYGAGLRLHECLMLRVKDVDFSYRQILVRDGKGGKDRMTMLPEAVIQPLHQHLGRVRTLHRKDLAEGYGEVWLPNALSRKYPRAAYEWGWQFIFPSKNRSAEPETGVIRRHHIYPDTLHRAVKGAARAAGIYKPVSAHIRALRPPALSISRTDVEHPRRDQLSVETFVLQRLRQQKMRRRPLDEPRQNDAEGNDCKTGPDPTDQGQCDTDAEHRQHHEGQHQARADVARRERRIDAHAQRAVAVSGGEFGVGHAGCIRPSPVCLRPLCGPRALP